MAFRVTDADVVRPCTIGNRAVASRGSSHPSPRRMSKEPLSRRVNGRSNPEVVGSIPTEVKRFFLCLVWFPVSLY